MAFIVSARKYRPQKFKEVVGQQSTTTTLKNAIKNDKLAQSFLFCGPRGVGKTTCARILAKVINCQNVDAEVEPCGACPSCTSFDKSASFNIFELDAASNNSVEDIRKLIEQVRFAPQSGKYKVYIIDEVHMLSQAAFNAFLKTLEEPPPYAVFILATTEKHKIIPTILSRCQIFDFARIKVAEMVTHLEAICTDQQITAEKDALHIIAQKADGALRDALSIFDRVASFSDGHLAYQHILHTLNVLDYDYYFKLVYALLTQDSSTTLLLFDEIIQKGFEGSHFISGLAKHLRNLLVCKDTATVRLLEVSDNLKRRYHEQASIAPNSFIISSLSITNHCELNYKASKNKRLQVELALLKMCFIQQAIDLSKLPITTTSSPSILAQISNTNITKEQAETIKPNIEVNISKPVDSVPKKQKEAKKKDDWKAKTKASNISKNSIQIPTSLAAIGKIKQNATSKPTNLNSNEQNIKKEEKSKINHQKTKKIDNTSFQKVWKAYWQKLSVGTLQSHYRLLSPKLQNNTIQIESGKLAKEAIHKDKGNFLKFLREQGFDTEPLQFNFIVKKNDNTTPKSSYLEPNAKIFKLMTEKNPKLSDLKECLGLELSS